MGRSRENDIAMRAAINDAVKAVNSNKTEAAAEHLHKVWLTYFCDSEGSASDHDALMILNKMMKQFLPDDAETLRASEFLKEFELLYKLNIPVNALYDLGLYPPQYDFVTFLAQAKTMAEGRPLHIVFQPHEDGGYVKPAKYSNEEAIYRMVHICLPACLIYGATCTILPSRESQKPEGEWLSGLSGHHNTLMDVFDRYGYIVRPKATKRASELVGQYVAGFEKPVITITLRSTFRNTSRNTDIDIWFEVADKLADNFQFVFVPDTSKAFDAWDSPYEAFPIGSVDLDSRLALYELAEMNFFNSNGTATLGWFGTIPFMAVGVRAEGYVSENDWERLRLPVGTQPPYLLKRQKIIWDQVGADEIIQEFQALMADT